MNKKIKGRKFGRRTNHRNALICNLLKAVIIHKRINTTLAKAKDIRSSIEKLVSKARNHADSLHARRYVMSQLRNDQIAAKILVNDIAPLYKTRPGGYTRIMKNGYRSGDKAPMAIIEFVGYDPDKKIISNA